MNKIGRTFLNFSTVVFFLIFLIVLGCKSDRPFEDFNLLLDPNEVGLVDSLVADIDLESSFKDTLANTGNSLFLSLGAFNNIQSRILLRFGAVPDTVEIARAILILDTNTLFSEGRSKSKFGAIVRQIKSPWAEQTVTFDNFNFDTTSVLSVSEVRSTIADISADSSRIESTRFQFNETGLQIIRDWASSSADTHGILVDFQGSDFVKEFFSRAWSVNNPRIELHVSENDVVVDTILTRATADAYVATDNSDLPDGPLYTDHLFSYQSVIRFDLRNIPRESTINRASLVLTVDRENTIVSTSGFTFQLLRLTDFDELTKISTLDSVLAPLTGVVDQRTSEVSLNIRDLLQLMITQPQEFENKGFLLRSSTPGNDISRIAFHSKQTRPGLAPRLQIEYSATPTLTNN